MNRSRGHRKNGDREGGGTATKRKEAEAIEKRGSRGWRYGDNKENRRRGHRENEDPEGGGTAPIKRTAAWLLKQK